MSGGRGLGKQAVSGAWPSPAGRCTAYLGTRWPCSPTPRCRPGYEGRCSLPSNFDATYTYSLGHAAAALLAAGKTGLMATISDMNKTADEWGVGGTPLVSMMTIERRSGKDKPVIRKALVELEGPAMRGYRSVRDYWALHDCYRSPGPIQVGNSGG